MSQVCTTLSALLLEEDTSSESDTVSATNEPTQVLTVRKPPTRAFNGSRSRRRHEILSLREQVIALQEIIVNHTGALPSVPLELEHKIQRARRWQAVAQSQRDQRRASEAERDRLRRGIKQQRHLIRSVARILGKQRALRSALRQDNLYMRSQIVQLKSANEFEDISSHLPTMILQLNGLFLDPRLASHTGQLRDVRVMNEKTANMTVEMLNSRVVPFDMEATARAVWQFGLVKIQKVTHWMEEQAEESDNSMRRTFEASFNFPSFQGKAEGRLAAWRIVEPERVVILHCAVLDNATSQTALGNFGVRLFNWTVIGPPRNEQLRSRSHDTCQIDTFEVTVPTVLDSTVLQSPATFELMKKLCVEATDYLSDVECEGVENILLEGQLHRSGVVFRT